MSRKQVGSTISTGIQTLPAKVLLQKRNPYLVFIFSVIFACLTLLLRVVLSDFLGATKNTFALFYPALLILSLAGGWLAGVTALVLFAIGSSWFLLAPVNSIGIHDRHDLVGFVIFNIVAILIIMICESLRRSKWQYEKQTQELSAISTALQESTDQLQTILENVADGIVVRNNKGKPIFANRSALEHFGIDPNHRRRFLQLTEMENQFTIYRANGKRIKTDQLPVKRVIHGETNAEDILCFRNKKSKKELWFVTRARGIYSPTNKLLYIVGVFADITERRTIEKQKDDFIGIASHELKTPVTSIKMYAQALQIQLKQEGNAMAVDFLKKMDSQINRLTLLITDLLDITRIESGRLTFHETTFALKGLLIEIIDNIQQTTDKHILKLETKDESFITADRERIAQVFTNFLTNAIKYSPAANEVRVFTKKDDSTITVCVRDFGKGIPEEKQKKVFQRFYRETGTNDITIPGLGLGLYISNEIIKRHKGKISVKSKLGKGSTFCFTLPTNANTTL